MKILAIIPARMNSSRFPGKPLKKINGKEMINIVYENTISNHLLTDTYVATCDHDILDCVKINNGKAILTSSIHQRATDRCAEAFEKIEKIHNTKYDIILMVQGDEPMINSDMITHALEPLIDNKNILVSNLLGQIKTKEEFLDKNCIKVVIDKDNFAVYFSRHPIPHNSRHNDKSAGKQICVIPFQRDFLLKYISLPMTPLEEHESIDMLRIIEHGYKIKMVPTKFQSYSVDTEEDLQKVQQIMSKFE